MEKVEVVELTPLIATALNATAFNQKLLHTARPVSPDETLQRRDFASNFWREIFVAASEQKATDIHIQQFGDRIRIRFRLQGELVIVQEFFEDPLTRGTVINRLKQICNLDLSSNDIAQDQATYIKLTGARYRVALVPGVFGENIVLRVIRDADIPALDKIGMRPPILADLKSALLQKQGFICITGPTGSGKSTTLQAAIMSIDRIGKNIITIEDPVERFLPDITQEQISKKLDWSMAIKMAMRQDPDVILVGEIRDRESAQLALEAAQTGHLVLSTLHTNDVAGIVDRLIGLGVDRKLIADNLLFISAQRLVQTLCACKIPVSTTPPASSSTPFTRNRDGCQLCQKVKGIGGRKPIVEYALKPDPAAINNFNKKDFKNTQLKTSLYRECEFLVNNGEVDYMELAGWAV
ncbi:MAG: Flp pilus assembly complex ATPase component TadA [Oligoflexia bacterium]|nr:Flp pilus assembly complex ATPase component TadA [Oligoflexia bacterium]